jgi:hypothetical protein
MKSPAGVGQKLLMAYTAFLLFSHTAIAQDGLVAYWSFDSVNADTFYDVTGHGHDAVGTGDSIGITDGISGKALNCKGKGFDIIVKNSITDFALNSFTIEAWIYSYIDLQNPGSFYNYKLLFDNSMTGMGGSGIRGGYALVVSDVGVPYLSGSTPDETDWIEALSDSTLFPKQWYHLAATYDGNMMKIFVNGRLTGSLPYAGGFKRTPVPARIGCQYQVYDESGATGLMRDWFIGKIDEMKLYNYALDAQTIAHDYQALARNRLVAYWSFDSVSADTFYDVTGHGHDAVGTGNSIGITQGISGKALDCKGTGFDIVVKNSITDFSLNAFTIEAWIYSYVTLQNPGSFYNFKLVFDNSLVGMGGSGIRGGYGLVISDVGVPYLSGSTPDETNWIEVHSDSTLFPKQWYHLAATYDGETMKIYLNGKSTGSLTYAGGFKRTPVPARIGCQYQVYDETGATGLMRDWFIGKIDELKLYNCALDAQTITNDYQVLALNGSIPTSMRGTITRKDCSLGKSVSYFNQTLAIYGDSKPAGIWIFAVNGMLMENRLLGNSSGLQVCLDLKKYPPGAYMYRVVFANSEMKTGKFIIEK